MGGGDRLRRAVLTESARRVSGLVTPIISAMAKRSLSREGSPVRDSRRSSLFDDTDDNDDVESVVENVENVVENVENVPARAEVFDPVAPLSSPVTKTYGRKGVSPARKQRQIDDFDKMVGDEEKTPAGLDMRYFMPGTPAESQTGGTPPPASGAIWSTSSDDQLSVGGEKSSVSDIEQDKVEEASSSGKTEASSGKTEASSTAKNGKRKSSTDKKGRRTEEATSTGRRRTTRQSVKFTPDAALASPQAGLRSATVRTPHPSSGRTSRLRSTDDQQQALPASPQLRTRVSLLPGMSYDSPAAAPTSDGELISFDSPVTNSVANV